MKRKPARINKNKIKITMKTKITDIKKLISVSAMMVLMLIVLLPGRAQSQTYYHIYMDSVAQSYPWDTISICRETYAGAVVHASVVHPINHWDCPMPSYDPYADTIYVPNSYNFASVTYYYTGGGVVIRIVFEDSVTSPNISDQTLCGNTPIVIDAGSGVEYLWSTGVISQTISTNITGQYWVMKHSSCNAITDTFELTFVAPVAQLCMVTFDTATQKNSVIWNGINEQVDKAIILKRNLSNVMVPVDTVNFTDGAWIDYQSTPLTDQHEYSMLLLDTCNNISDTATHHKTIWLQISSYSTDVYFHYTPYMGITVPTYTLRGIKANGTIDSLKSVAAAFSDFSLPASIAQNYQRFYIDFTTSCGSSKSVIKVQSNTVSGPTGINDYLENNKLSIFPNPAHDRIYIKTPETTFETEIINVFGQVLSQDRNKTEIDISTLPTGTYILRLTGNVDSGQKCFIVY